MREGLKLARALGNASPISECLGTETSPGPSVSTDDEWDSWLIEHVGTEYHPTGTCAMLPESSGGVVSAKLQVYGLGTCLVPHYSEDSGAAHPTRVQLMSAWQTRPCILWSSLRM